ncbi:MAG: UvrD-helicase domain-containing protein, partial [bacterium]|nr:UvrD-helicase domain-containing protein [bacterium]
MRPTDAQERAITTIDRDVCVDAGAGSGKTRVLIGRIMYLLQQKHATLDEIVAITFTEKAASEMKERLRRSCREQAPRDDSDRMTFWRDIERRVDTARISTIHGFCMNLLKQNAFSAGLDPEFAMLSEAESHLLRSETVQETVHRLLDEEDEAATRLAVELGTGRLSTELRGMLNQTASLERIVSSPDYADPEALARRWEEWVAPRRHALCVDLQAKLRAAEGCCTKTDDRREVLRQNLTRILDAVLSADDPTAACAAMAEVGGLTARGGSKKNWTSEDAWQEVKDVLDGLREAASWAAEGHALGAIGLKSAQLACDLVSTYRHVATAFEEAKQARNAFAFDDLILIALSILRDNDEVRSRVAQGIKHLLIDEFQDTDSRQLEIARLLTGDTEGPRLFIVGDAKQSIYRFRGAEVEVFGDARQDTQEQIVLKDNFRTLPDVLEFVNDLFARSGLLHRVEPEYRHLEPFRTPVDEARVEVLAVPGMDGANTDDYREHEAEMIA